MEQVNVRQGGRKENPEGDTSLEPQVTMQSDKTNDLQLEAESMAPALESENGESIHDQNAGDDLEKATTQATRTSNEPATRITTAVDWNGPDDPENPQRWPFWKKTFHTFAIGALAFAVTCGSSLISPATPEIEEHFGVSRTAAILPLTLYVIGLAFGPVLGAPISETFGRSVVYKVTAPVFMLFLIGAGFSKSFGSLLVCRFLAGTAGAPVLAVGAGSNADMFPPQTRAVAVSFFVMMPFLGPSLGPIIGGFTAQFKGWRWTQWVSIFIGVVAYALVLFMSETYKKVILTKRAKKHGVEGPPNPPIKGLTYIKLLVTITLARPVHMLFTEPIVLLLSLYNSFCFSVLFAFFAAYPYTFEKEYGFNTWQYGLAFLGILVGIVLAATSTILLDRKVFNEKWSLALKEGRIAAAPEHRLYAAILGSFGVPIGLFWFAWTARSSVHWIVPILAGIPFAWGNLSIFLSAALYLVDVYGPLNGASALAANGLARYTCGAVFPLFTFQMYEGLGIGWATSLLGVVSVAMLPIPWVLFKYGPRIRARSGYDTLKV